MKILHVTTSVDPSTGGPIAGVVQRGLCLQRGGHTVEIVCLDAPGAPHVESCPLPVTALGPSLGRYRFNRRLVPWLRRRAAGYDAVVVHGIWQYTSFGAWRALRPMGLPYFVFPHGMLDPWFRSQYPLKHLKKWLYWPWADYRVLRDATAVLYTSEEEMRLAQKSFWLFRANGVVVNYGAAAPPPERARTLEAWYAAQPGIRGSRYLLFLGRLHRKKGCDLVLQAFARIAREQPEIKLVIAGPDQSGWAQQLAALAERDAIAERIIWPGMLQGAVKWGALLGAEAFVLPSHQENFGIAVAEALGCGLPVLISDKINIWREVETDGAGIVRADTLEGTESALRAWFALSAQRRADMARAARACFERRFTVEAMASGLVTVLERFGSRATT